MPSVNQEVKLKVVRSGSSRRRRKEPASSFAFEVPPLRTAALEPVWSNRKLILPPNPAASDNGPVVLAMALKFLRDEIDRLAAAAECDAAISQKTIGCLRGVACRIPVYAPAQDELFYLAHLKEFLEAYAQTANNGWPAYFVDCFAVMTHRFDCTVQQFPKWREFACNAEQDPLSSDEAAEIPILAAMTVAGLREEEACGLIDPAIPTALDVLQAPLQSEIARPGQPIAGPAEMSKRLLANDLLASVENIAKRTAEAALVANEAVSSGGTDGKQAYIWMKRTLSKIMENTPTLTLHARFCWLKPIISLMGR